MNQIRLTCVERTHWHRGKGFFNVVAPLAPPPPPPTETTTKASPAAAATQSPAPLTSASPTHIEVLADSQQLYVWSLANGCEAFKKNASNSVMSHVLYATSNGTHSGIFFSFNKNKGIGFALVEHCLEKPKHLAAKPTVFTEELAVLLDNVYPAAEKKQKRSKYLPFFSVRSAELRRTSDGDVLAAVLSTLSGDMYVISAVLSSNTWRKWKIDGQFGISPTLWISPTGKEVKLMRCEICAPVNPRLAVEAQSVPLALSVFDRVAADWDNGITTAFAVDAKCVVLREKLFRTNNTMTVTERTFQSQCFHLGAEKEHRFYPYQCFLEVDRDTPLFTIVVPCQTFSCIVHLTYAVGGSELQATCNVLNRCIEPVSIATLPVICPERPTGTRISLVLAQDLKIYACEVFGAMVDVNVQNNNGVINSSEDGNLLNFQVPAKTNKSKAAGEDSGSISFTRLLALRESECMTCNGKVAAFFRVDEAKLFGALPEAAATTRVSTVPDTTRPDGAVRLSECLSKIDSMADSMHLAELPDEVFRTIIPALQFVGSSEQEIFLMQKLYDYLLHIVTPRTEAEWNYLWSLTSILQRVIAKRSASNAIVYTDQFFLKLANTYRRSKFATEEGTELVFDGLRAVISDEMKTLLTQPIKDLRTEAQFLLDGCASQEPLLLLVEEVARRMVDVSMLSNGACVVRPNNGLGACVHAAGTVLLASCFDVPLYVGGERGELRCSATLDSDVSVYMEPRTFSSQHEFECALTLATDLLCIVSDADEARSIDIALTALSVTRRNHCLYAYLQLVTPLITVIAAAQRPDYTEEKAFIECATRMMSNPLGQEMSRTLLLDQSHNLMTRMAYVVSTGGRELNYEVYRLVATAFGAESSLLCMVSLLMHATERVVSAQNNYAAAVAQSLVFRGSQRPSTAVTHNIHECRQRLSEVLTKAMVVLAQMHVLTAYKLEDISSCFLDTIQLSRDLAAAAGSSSQFKGTAASKTVIMCFRLIMLAWYTRLLEESLDDAVRTSEQFPPTGGPLGSINADGTLELHPTVEGSMRLLRIMYALNGSALPAEWMQMKILRMLFCAVDLCHQHPDWSPYFMQILRLSQVGGARLDSLNQDMRQVVSELNEASTYQVSDAQRVASAAVVQQCSLQAEEIVHVMTAQTPSGSGAGGVQNRNAVRFVFSNTIDDGMPAWVHPHVLEGREYCEDWTSNLTAVEMISPMLHEAVSLFCERLTEESARETLLTVTESACTSPELSRPLFEHVCLVKPPVRTHAMIAQSDSPSDIRRVGPLPPSEPEVKMMSSSNTPRRGSAPTSVLHSLSVTAAPALVVKPDIGHLELTSSGEVLAATIATLPPKAETVVDPAARVDCQQPPTSLPEKLASTSKVFTPAEVAWWESVIPPPAAEEDEVRSEVTATSYTTVTTISQRHIDVYQAPTSLEWKRAGDRRHVHVESNSTTSDRQHPYTTTRHTDRCHSRRCRCSRRRTLDAGDVQRQKSKPPMRSSSTAVGMDGGWRTSSGSRNAEARRKADEPLQLLHFHHTMLSPPAAPTGISAAQQPPPQPSSWRRCGSAPVSHRASNDAGLEVPLLQLQGQAASKPKVRLYLPAQTSAGMEIPGLPPSPPLGIPSGSLQPPPLPSSSVFSAPPALLRLPTGTVNTPPRAEHSPPMEAPMTMPAPSTLPSPLEAQMPASQVNLLYPSAVPVHPARTEPAPLPTASGPLPTAAYSQVPRAHETGELSMAHYTNSTIPPPSVRVPIAMPVASPFAQVPRAQEHAGQPYVVPPPVAPVAPWPAAPLAAPSPYAQVPRSEPVTTTPIPSSGPLAQPSASFAPPLTAAPSVTALPSPAAVPSATLSPMNLPLHNSLLNPCEAADFHRYIDELRRGAVPGGSSPSPAVMPSLSVPLRPEATSIAPSVAAAEVPVVGSRQPPSHAGQDEFMYRVETLLQQQSAENANFYRGVREFLHATPARSSGGLSATEQSQLLRTSLKQQSQVADLNHQLLDMQLRQARVEGTQGPTLPSTLDTSVKPLEGLGGDVLRYCSSIVPPHPVEKPLPPSLLATTTTIGGTGPMPAATPLPIPESMGQGTQTQVLTTHDAGVSPRPLDPPAALPSSTASMGMEATMKELVQLNAQIQGVHSSTEAMERALTETQHALGHYRRLGAMEASAAEGEALRTAIRFQTEAAERRLGELLPSTHLPPKIVEPAVPAYPSNVTPLPSGVVTSSSAKAGNATLYSAGTQVPVTSPRIFTDQHSSKCPSSSGEAAATAHNSTTMPPPPPPMADRAQHRRSFMGHSVDAISSNSAPSMVAASPAAASAYWRKDSDALKPLAEVPEPNALPESPVIQPAKECQRVVPPAPAVSLLQVYRSAAHTSAPPHDLIEVKTRQAERRPAARRTATTPNRYSMYRSSPPRNPVSKISTATRSIAPRPQSSHASTSRTHSKAVPSSSILGNAFVSRQTTRRMQSVTECMAMLEQELR